MSERRCLECEGTGYVIGNPLLDHMWKRCPSCEPQEGAPSKSVSDVDRTVSVGGVPPCDSPELAAIRKRIDTPGQWTSSAKEDARTLLRMVEELTEELRQYRAFVAPEPCDGPTGEGPSFRHDEMKAMRGLCMTLREERDELRAKLAEAEKENEEACKANDNLLTDWAREKTRADAAETKLAEAEKLKAHFQERLDSAIETIASYQRKNEQLERTRVSILSDFRNALARAEAAEARCRELEEYAAELEQVAGAEVMRVMRAQRAAMEIKPK